MGQAVPRPDADAVSDRASGDGEEGDNEGDDDDRLRLSLQALQDHMEESPAHGDS